MFSTSASSLTYARRVRPDPRTFVPLMVTAFLGSVVGALVASRLPREAFVPIVLGALVLVGGDDLLTPVDHSRAMADVLPGARLVVVEGAGHMVTLERHELVSEELRALVERARPA